MIDPILLNNKIDELFEYRQFPHLYLQSGVSAAECQAFNTKLKELQSAIYYLDDYLEHHWEIDETKLEEKWQAIYQSLNAMGIAEADHKDYTKNIAAYQRHELQLRSFLLPTRLDIEYYYFYKSCDVKLMRRLILEKFPKLNTLFKPCCWRQFDLVTEVNDDVTDMEEDIDTINGNGVLLYIHEFGKAKTIEIFSAFLDKIDQASLAKKGKNKNQYEDIKALTSQNILETKKLLIENINNFTSEQMEAVKLFTLLHKR